MSQRTKLLERIRNNPNDVAFSDLTAALEGLGFPLIRTTGSHHYYGVGGCIVVVPRHGSKVKAYVVRQALGVLDEFYGDE